MILLTAFPPLTSTLPSLSPRIDIYKMPHSGQCLCGQVKITVASTHDAQVKCHCTSCTLPAPDVLRTETKSDELTCGATGLDCQHASGSAHSTDVMVKISDVKVCQTSLVPFV